MQLLQRCREMGYTVQQKTGLRHICLWCWHKCWAGDHIPALLTLAWHILLYLTLVSFTNNWLMKSAHMGQRIYWSEQPTHLGASASQPTLSPLSFLSSPHSQAAVQRIGGRRHPFPSSPVSLDVQHEKYLKHSPHRPATRTITFYLLSTSLKHFCRIYLMANPPLRTNSRFWPNFH